MSDFDFDEIDKAVNGVLGNDTPESAVPAPEENETAQPAQPEERGSLTSSRDMSDKTAASMPAARRGSTGRFMDMVHPSSDMRRASSEPATEAPVPTPAPSAAPRVPEPPTFFKEPAVVSGEETKPLESPFLPDAKVEKRPLGAPVSDTPTPLTTLFTEPKEELLEAPEEELKLEPSDEPLIEAESLPDPIDFHNSLEAAKTQNDEVSAEPTPEEPSHESKPEEGNHDVPSPALNEEIAGPSSITQQYKEQPSGAQEPGAIYDTESYHQPLTTPPKKRSGAWVFLWIFLLIILGAAAGAAIYLFVLPRM